MLQASNEEQKVWQARLAITAKYQKVLILTVHHADGLPSADQDGFSDPYCKMGELEFHYKFLYIGFFQRK